MKRPRRVLPVILIVLIFGVVGYVIGKSTVGTIDTLPVVEVAAEAAPLEAVFVDLPLIANAPPTARFQLPPGDVRDAAGMTDYVAALRAAGISEDFARWLAIRAAVRTDAAAALGLARSEDLVREWAAAVALADPAGGFELLRSVKSLELFGPLGPKGPVSVFFETLGRTDPARGLDLLGRMPSFRAKQSAPALFGSWAALDADAALAAAEGETVGIREAAMLGVFQEWGARDRRSMLAWANDRDESIATAAMRSQYDPGAPRDPLELIKLAAEFPKTADWFTLVNSVDGLIPLGRRGWEALLDFPEGSVRDGMTSRFAYQMASRDPQAAWDFVQSLPEAERGSFLGGFIFRELAKVAPAEVAELALAGEQTSHIGLSEVVAIWAGSDPSAALDWSVRNLTGRDLLGSTGGALRGWAMSDPLAARRALDTLPPSLRARALPELYEAWGATQPEGALASARALSPMDRTRATSGVIEGWAFEQPAAAADALAGLPADGLERAYDQIAWRWTARDPAAAMAWVTTLRDEGKAQRAARLVAESWAQKDASAAAQRVNALTAGPLRDHGTAGLVRAIRELDPPAAAGWAQSIQSPDLRRSGLRDAVVAWKDKDVAAAGRFVDGLAAGPERDELRGILQ